MVSFSPPHHANICIYYIDYIDLYNVSIHMEDEPILTNIFLKCIFLLQTLRNREAKQANDHEMFLIVFCFPTSSNHPILSAKFPELAFMF